MVPLSLICHTSIFIRGQHVNWSPFSLWNGGINRRWHVRLIISEWVLAQWRRLVALMKATNLLHQAMRAIVPAKKVHFASLFCWLSSWRLQGQYGASSCLMAASSGFRCSPGHAASGNATCFVLTPPLDRQNGLQQRHIRSLPPIFCLTPLVAKDHVMVH